MDYMFEDNLKTEKGVCVKSIRGMSGGGVRDVGNLVISQRITLKDETCFHYFPHKIKMVPFPFPFLFLF